MVEKQFPKYIKRLIELMYNGEIVWTFNKENDSAVMIPRDASKPYEIYSFKDYLIVKEEVYKLKEKDKNE